MNVKRAVAAAVGVLGTLILVVALGAGYLAGHSSSARAGASTPTNAAPGDGDTGRDSRRGQRQARTAIYGDSTRVSAIYGDGIGVAGTTTSPSTTTTGNTITVTPTDGTGVVTAAIFGD